MPFRLYDADSAKTDQLASTHAAEQEKASSEAPVARAKPSKPAPAAAPVIKEFNVIPEVGDRFRGKAFYVTSKEAQLSIPGLDDVQAYAVIAAGDQTRKVREDDIILCEVIGKEQEANKTWKVRCRII
jgi:hypothetical protein